MGPGGMPPVPVSVAVAAREVVPVVVTAVGTVEPYSTVQVKSQVDGQLLRVHFTEGGQVNKGDLLFEIDPSPFQDALRQAEAAVARDIAQLKQSEANLGRDRAQALSASAEKQRQDELFKAGITARSQFDQVRANADALDQSIKADEAAIESARASLESDRAAVAHAKLNLSYCRIQSPISGRAGNLLVHPGNLVRLNDTSLVVINQVEPIFVSFGAPEDRLPAIRARSAGRKLPVDAILENEGGKTVSGVLSVIDNTVDANTGMIRLKATFDNKERKLWPGQFVNVVLKLDASEETVVPSEAIQAGQQGQFVYVVNAKQTAEFRPVAVGRVADGKTVVMKGVMPGETVVTDGQLRLFPGAPIHAIPASQIDSQKL
jgi:multidrug efflux system membrane fusion protein